jgi:hypothetical protein
MRKIVRMYNIGEMYDFIVFSKYGSWAGWISDRYSELKSDWGVDSDLAEKVAVQLAYAMNEGLAPRITRGWSDPKHQDELRKRWDRGDRAGLRVRPAENSKHTTTGFLGRKAATAIDIPTNNDARMAQIARALGIGAGADFKDSDPGHYFQR